MLPTNDLEAIRTTYDTVAENYAEYAAGEMDRQPFDRSMFQAFADLLREDRADRADGGGQADGADGTARADGAGQMDGRGGAGRADGSGGAGRVAELGCGPGRISAHLHGLGLDVFGVDLSPAMIRIARSTYPDLRFDVGTMTAVDVPDASLTGVVAWYSIIHTPPERLSVTFAEFARILAPGGRVLLAFQVGDEPRHVEHAYDHDVSLLAYRLQPEHVERLLVDEGFTITARLVRAAVEPEYTPQAYVMARTPAT